MTKIFEKVNGVKLNYKIGPRREGDVEACWTDTKKINEVMGWKATKTITEAMKDSWEWEKKLRDKLN